MKTITRNFIAKVLIFLFFCGAIVLSGFQASGVEWTDEQKQVWKMVEAWWEYAKQGDVDALSANYYVMDSFEWPASEVIPMGRKEILPKLKEWFAYDKPVSFELEPINIHVVGDVAIVFYSWKWKGNILSDSGRTSDTYVKQQNKWKFMGSGGCSCNTLPTCK